MKFTHDNYDGKHWLKGSPEAKLDNEINRLNKQAMKYAKAGAMDSKAYKNITADIYRMTGGQIRYVNGAVQGKRGAKAIADAVKNITEGKNQYYKRRRNIDSVINKSKKHATFEQFTKVAKKFGLTPNELSLVSNQSELFFQALYADDSEEEEAYLEFVEKQNKQVDNLSTAVKETNKYIPVEFEMNARDFQEIRIDDIINPLRNGKGWTNVETGEFFDNYDDALRSYDNTIDKLMSGEWRINKGYWNENIDWDYWNQFERKKEW